jgi:hypothetical protein
MTTATSPRFLDNLRSVRKVLEGRFASLRDAWYKRIRDLLPERCSQVIARTSINSLSVVIRITFVAYNVRPAPARPACRYLVRDPSLPLVGDPDSSSVYRSYCIPHAGGPSCPHLKACHLSKYDQISRKEGPVI